LILRLIVVDDAYSEWRDDRNAAMTDDENTSLRQVVASDLTLEEDGILAPVP